MDLRNLSEALGLDEPDVLDLVDLFLETRDSDVSKIEAGVRAGDHRQVAEAAHSIKGASGNMRFEGIYALASDIEESARKQDLSHISVQLGDIRKELELIASDFKDIRK